MPALILPGIYNLAAVLLFPFIIEGILGKLILARAQSRRGSGILQPLIDHVKLLAVEDPMIKREPLRNLLSAFALAAVGLSALAVPMGAGLPLREGTDVIFLFYVFSFAPTARSLEVVVSSSCRPDGFIRSVFTSFLLEEAAFFLALLTVSVRAHSLQVFHVASWVGTNGYSLSAGIAFLTAFIALQIQMTRYFRGGLELEQDLYFMSGPRLACFRWLFPAFKYVQASLLVHMFLPWPLVDSTAGNMTLHLLKVLMFFVPAAFLTAFRPAMQNEGEKMTFRILVLCASAALALALKGG